MENHKRLPFIVLIGALLISDVFFGLNYFFQKAELSRLRNLQGKSEINGEVLDFTKLFIEEVLQAEGEVDFETRLTLENSVRALEDKEIMTEWQAFIGSRTEAEAQDSVKRLLELLVSKIRE